MFEVFIKPSTEKQLDRLTAKVRNRVVSCAAIRARRAASS
jgi:hypothetical protein